MSWYEIGRLIGLVLAPLIAAALVYAVGLAIARFQYEDRAAATRRRFGIAGFIVWIVVGLILLEHYLRAPRPGG
jgi:hypothetical protein